VKELASILEGNCTPEERHHYQEMLKCHSKEEEK
jgi:hypothetical protein